MQSFIQPHAVTVYVIHANKYLIIRRCCEVLNGTWQMVTGRIEEGEKAWEAAIREVKEETGLVPESLYSADIVETFYIKASDKIAFVPVFVAYVDSQKVKLCPAEHDAFEWVEYQEAKERFVWFEQKRIITHIHENFILKEPFAMHLIQEAPCSLK
jgi:dATP pyrophosphohydrolase